MALPNIGSTPRELRYNRSHQATAPNPANALRRAAIATQNPKFRDQAFDFLQRAPLTDDQRADIWDLFHSSTSANELSDHLKELPLPAALKQDLVQAKLKPAIEPDDSEKVMAILNHMKAMDPRVLEVAEKHPHVLKAVTDAAHGGAAK